MPILLEPRVGQERSRPRPRRSPARPLPSAVCHLPTAWTCRRCGHINLRLVPRCGLCHAEPPVSSGRARESLLDDLVELLVCCAGLCCVAAERPELRKHTAHTTLVQLTDARDHLAAAARILNPE